MALLFNHTGEDMYSDGGDLKLEGTALSQIGLDTFNLELIFEHHLDAELPGACIENLQHAAPSDSDKSVPPGAFHLPCKMNIDIVPVDQFVDNGLGTDRIV